MSRFVVRRFVVRYRGPADPPTEEERLIADCLDDEGDLKVVDRMPGSLLVEGDEADVARAVERAPCWVFSPEVAVVVSPPHKRLRRPGS